MFFNVLWSILLGVIGGIISSLIVSRVFFIQGEYQEQFKFVERITRKINYISAFLQSAKAVFEVSYDEDIRMEREMKEKGYRTEMEYYAAHKDKRWISKSDLLATFKKEIVKTVESINTEMTDNLVKDKNLNMLLRDMITYAHEVSSADELTFSSISGFMKTEQALMDRYDKYRKMSGNGLFKLIIKDKFMIIMFLVLAALIAGTVITNLLGI